MTTACPPLEGLWWQDDKTWEQADRDNWQWQLLILVPAYVTDVLVEEAREQARTKHPEAPYDLVELIEFEEGPSVQMLHIGPYATEPQTTAKMHEYMAMHGLEVVGKHHEIYMGDPRRSAPDKLKTVLRYPVTAA